VRAAEKAGVLPVRQVAAGAALDGPQDCVDEARQVYRSRRDALVDSFCRAGWDVPSPEASMFAWARIPGPCSAMSSLEFSLDLMNGAHVGVSPGTGFGEYGEGYVRIALVENEQRIRQAARNIKQFLARAEEVPAVSDRRAVAS